MIALKHRRRQFGRRPRGEMATMRHRFRYGAQPAPYWPAFQSIAVRLVYRVPRARFSVN